MTFDFERYYDDDSMIEYIVEELGNSILYGSIQLIKLTSIIIITGIVVPAFTSCYIYDNIAKGINILKKKLIKN